MSAFDDLAERNRDKGPILCSMAYIIQARGFRETDQYAQAIESLGHAKHASKSEKNPFIRSYLEASCLLHQGWVDYRRERFEKADAAVASALAP